MKTLSNKLGKDVTATRILIKNSIIFSIFLLIFASCGSKKSEEVLVDDDCVVEQSPYDLAGAYFNDEDTVVLLVRFVKFAPLRGGVAFEPYEAKRTLDTLNRQFRPAKIKFALLETVLRRDIEAYMNMQDYRAHTLEFKRDIRQKYQLSAIDIFIYPPTPSFYPGAALAIPSDGIAIQSHVLNSSTLIHEMGHCLGLHHTHFGLGEGYEEGDLVCDLPNVLPETNLIDANCAYKGMTELSEEEMQTVINNYMSYSRSECRKSFTKDQVDRMRSTIEKYPILIEKILL